MFATLVRRATRPPQRRVIHWDQVDAGVLDKTLFRHLHASTLTIPEALLKDAFEEKPKTEEEKRKDEEAKKKAVSFGGD